MPRIVRCPNCSAPLEVDLEKPVVRCQYCGCDVKQTIAIQPPPPKPEPTRPRPEPPVVSRPPPPVNVGKAIRWVWFALVISLIGGAIPVLCSTGTLSRLPEFIKSARNRIAGSSEKAARTGAPASESQADHLLGQKLDVYADCLTSNSTSAQFARERYHSWQPNRAGPSCRERYISYGVPRLNVTRGPGGCGERVGEMDNKPPKLVALEEAADSFVTILHELDDVLTAANRYYDQKDYKEDNCVKGKQLHKQMMDAFVRFDAADAALRSGLEKVLVPLIERRLHRSAVEDSRGALHAYLKLLVDARQLFVALRARLLSSSGSTEATARALIKAIDLDISEADAADKRQPAHTPTRTAFETWAKSASLEYLKAAKEVMRRNLAPPRPATRRARHRDLGRGRALTEFVEKYNRFLRSMNAPFPVERPPSSAPLASSPTPEAALPAAELKPANKASKANKANKANKASKAAPSEKSKGSPAPKQRAGPDDSLDETKLPPPDEY